MQKILELTTEEWMTGCGIETNLDDAPIFTQRGTRGVSSVIPFLDDSEAIGALGVSANLITMSDYDKSTVGIITSGLKEGGTTYSYDDNGNIYERSSGIATLIRSGNPLTDGASGLAIFEKSNGDRYLLYARETGIGRTLLPIGSNAYADTWVTTGVENTTNHPMHNFQDRVYFGNGRYVGMISDEAGTMTVNGQALDLPASEEITNLSDDGKYLIIATKKGFVYFWNTNTDSWQRSYQIPNPGELYSVETVRNVTYCLGVEVLATVGFSTPPQVLQRFPKTNSTDGGNTHPSMGPVQHSYFRGGNLYTQNVAAVVGEGIIWGNGQNCLSYFGNITPGNQKRLHTFGQTLGHYGNGKSLFYILSVDNFQIDVFTHSYDFGSATSPTPEETEYFAVNNSDNSRYTKLLDPKLAGTIEFYDSLVDNVQAITRPINLEQNYQITGAKIIFANGLKQHRVRDFDYDPVEDNTYYDRVTIELKSAEAYPTFTQNEGLNSDENEILEWDHENGDESQIKRLKNPFTGEIIQLRIRFRELDPKIKSIIIYGEPVADLT